MTITAPAQTARDRVGSVLGPTWPEGTANVFSSACPSRTVLDHITSKWGVLIIVALADETLRWGELRRTIDGISEKMLAQTLRVLENDGLVLRTVHGTVPPRVDYRLTDLGRDLCENLISLLGWVSQNAAAIVSTPRGNA
ncbi:winged helix-turn-helix transcriptional regulator [Subtercola endophyticus]|uniref:winged helix-turn-helix transcriptional regulator n=1 Tax=Subtercola endophyticus TaxID=2895559 RepID=UPI001E294461|nr:helix-turn-helix domain-containing protein [Subtercola endophyticus]UFS58537.1 helix-turn-helix transcriptional regulator [Subtercola endophyticus]